MGRVKKPLRVIPNPYAFIDHNGQPCCAVMMHQGEHVPRGVYRYVGARIAEAVLVREARETQIGDVVHQTVPADHELVWEFSTEPVEVPDIGYYHEHITRGTHAALIAADESTARRCNIRDFKDPREILRAARLEAIKAWNADHGPGDFEDAERERSQAKKDRAEAKGGASVTVAAPVPPPTPTFSTHNDEEQA